MRLTLYLLCETLAKWTFSKLTWSGLAPRVASSHAQSYDLHGACAYLARSR
jgi:hypothetical protein